MRISLPLGQKSLEMAHEPRGVCFKLWVKKSCSCFLHSPHLARTLGMFCRILNQTYVANSHTAVCQLLWFSGKCIFGARSKWRGSSPAQKVLKRLKLKKKKLIIQNTPRKGPVFWPYGIKTLCYTTRTYIACPSWSGYKARGLSWID